MNGILLFAFAAVLFFLSYWFYSRFLAEKIYQLDPDRETPSHKYEDGFEFVPTTKEVVLGHHFTSIAGAAPIVGPALAVIWGWLPALLWVVFGTMFIGAVHDFGVLVMSMRKRGRSITDFIGEVLIPEARILMFVVVFFLIALVGAVFMIVIAVLFNTYATTVFPIWIEMVFALGCGIAVYRYGVSFRTAGSIALLGFFITVIIGAYWPLSIGETFIGSPLNTWIVLTALYGLFVTLLPVWALLQPRDWINAHELYAFLALFFIGLIALGPGADVVAPAIRTGVSGAPPFYPFLFIVIACGAISGWHSLVGSGTTPKQIDNEVDARDIGYGGMQLEGILAISAIIACVVGFASSSEWLSHYASWGGAAGLGPKVSAFVDGGAGIVSEGLHIPETIALTIFGVLIVSFAMTTLDTTVRMERYVISEVVGSYVHPIFENIYIGSIISVVVMGWLALQTYAGAPAGIVLWPLFGATNQILAALALLTISVYLYKRGTPIQYTFLPFLFMVITAGSAMIYNLGINWIPSIGKAGMIPLTIIGSVVVICLVGLIILAGISFKRARPG
ncbi:hypothetical protein AKJ48_02755 [candidate division MSBL1 archaeon SCGC-AAA261O19]|uniref:CstA N-terminal domain-containing protein n=4 Tax=candidate division MSBL1 TaxID=215777 RepID=A0A133VD94_9EURY|nr:hypothetical protein AKJ48_02755 [candidate division MSBL1 archaeon SCGC-AAA261O19]